MSEKTAEKTIGYQTECQRSHHPRKRWGGRTAMVVGRPNKRYVIPRSQNGSSSPGANGFEANQDKPYPTAVLPGKFRVQLPKGRIRYP